jgi:hypothetical protein
MYLWHDLSGSQRNWNYNYEEVFQRPGGKFGALHSEEPAARIWHLPAAHLPNVILTSWLCPHLIPHSDMKRIPAILSSALRCVALSALNGHAAELRLSSPDGEMDVVISDEHDEWR